MLHHPQPCAFDELAEAGGRGERVFGIGLAAGFDADNLIDQRFHSGRGGTAGRAACRTERVHSLAVFVKLEMQVGAGGLASGANIADQLPGGDNLPGFQPVGEGGEVGIAGFRSASMGDGDQIAIAAAITDPRQRAIKGGNDGCADGGGPIGALVQFGDLEDRVHPRPEARGQHAGCWGDHAAAQADPARPAARRGAGTETTVFLFAGLLEDMAFQIAPLALDRGIEHLPGAGPGAARVGGVEQGHLVAGAGKAFHVKGLAQHDNGFGHHCRGHAIADCGGIEGVQQAVFAADVGLGCGSISGKGEQVFLDPRIGALDNGAAIGDGKAAGIAVAGVERELHRHLYALPGGGADGKDMPRRKRGNIRDDRLAALDKSGRGGFVDAFAGHQLDQVRRILEFEDDVLIRRRAGFFGQDEGQRGRVFDLGAGEAV